MRKVDLPYDYLLDHNLDDLERLLVNSDMFTLSTVASINKIIAQRKGGASCST